MKRLASVILAAGDGTRLKSNRPKALHEVCGYPMLHHVLKVATEANAERHVVVVGYEGDQIRSAFTDRTNLEFADQLERLGTGHAMMMTRDHFQDYEGDILVLCGDTPLFKVETLQKLVEWHRHQDAAATILTAELKEPRGYGRILRYDDNRVQGIVEEKDANRYERAIREINTGTYCFDSKHLFESLGKINQDNSQNEYYLTDCIRILVDEGKRVEAVITEDSEEVIGVNTRVQLAQAERILRSRILERHMLEGITILDPDACYVDDEAIIGKDTVLYPGTIITGKTRIGEGCRIGPNTQIINSTVGDQSQVVSSYMEDTEVEPGAKVGPFANLQNGAASS
ncbi:MAG: bifunctional UDP-N-acetylglucosamine diphosphorylase/glucosamine-1-phosphate N-acetyltransferase GlmU [Candidatus Omnitrophica bacterium]|nr:bifunctional UDP-N-acetylglucosamine diphosphorylase/glucosamine-1-phosphate N-acetyltransferase GlmU [Candidatus Omnitrophota bacterium]MCA9429938.1 bifunctional UDP-N-acetylglucosamine diphosphorylase/glucosamine-1-phosphate N-acetyltransferase GlmU [Candidatus Omnitrophota bacterium]